MYSINLTLRKTGHSEYTIYAEKGHALHVLGNCTTAHEAMERARTWASTWASVCIRMEDE